MPPPPPITPSAHRFVARRDRNQPVSQSAARAARTPAQQDAVTPSQQFNATPRFSIAASRPVFSTTPRPAQATHTDDIADGLGTPSVFRRRRPRLSKVESIHDNSQEGSEDYTGQNEEMLYDSVADEDAFLVERRSRSLEESSQQPSDAVFAESTRTEEQPPKRRRLTPGPRLTPEPGMQIIDFDPMKLDTEDLALRSPPQSSKVPRFRIPGHIPTPATASAVELTPSQLIGSRHRNPFLLRPDRTESASDAGHTPLPEHFSPHRRSQKFLPGGMADVVRTWVLNAGQAGALAETASGNSGQRTDRVPRTSQPSTFRIDEFVEERPGDRLKLVSGSVNDDPGRARGEKSLRTRAILVGPAKRNSRSPKLGEEVTVLPPSWEVEVGQHGEKWLVAVDWRVA